jgi:5-methylcytosine-specific restriction endonuclease McrA
MPPAWFQPSDGAAVTLGRFVQMDSTKVCRRCAETKPLEDFNKRTSAKDGRASWCRECQRTYHAAWKIANPDKVKVNTRLYNERHKSQLLIKNATWRAANKERHKEMIRAWEARNPERVAAKSVRYRKRHPERFKEWQDKRRDSGRRQIANLVRRGRVAAAIIPGAEVTAAKLAARFAYFGWCCYYCGTALTARTVCAEHRIPLSRGGPHCCANIVPSCASCNVRKANRTEREYKRGHKGRIRTTNARLRAAVDVPEAT